MKRNKWVRETPHIWRLVEFAASSRTQGAGFVVIQHGEAIFEGRIEYNPGGISIVGEAYKSAAAAKTAVVKEAQKRGLILWAQ